MMSLKVPGMYLPDAAPSMVRIAARIPRMYRVAVYTSTRKAMRPTTPDMGVG